MRRWLFLFLLLTPLAASAQEAAVDPPPAETPEQPSTPAPPRRPPSAPT